jgi:hypothetical protein
MNTYEQAIINLVLQSVKPTMCYLYGRWLDEREYEEFDGYADAMRSALTKADHPVSFVRATRRPFGFLFDFAGRAWQLSVTSSAISIKPIAAKPIKAA